MDYEKKYNEALEKARKLYNDAKANEYKSDMEDYESIFPELAESEDERIRKCLCDIVNWLGFDSSFFLCNGVAKTDVLAYLEKQKDSASNNFDDVWDEEDCEEIIAEGQKLTPRFKELLKEVCHAWYDRGAKLEKQKEQKPVEWNDTDMKEARDNLISVCRDWERGEQTTLLPIAALRARYFLEHLTEPKPVEWSEEDADILNCCISSIEEAKENRYAYKETDGDTSYDREIAWLKSLSLNLKKKNEDVAKLCSNEWSEEDEKMLQSIIKDFRAGKVSTIGQERWLKSLRPQQRQEWSDEEKEILDSILSHYVLIDKPIDTNGISKEKYISLIKSLRFDTYKKCNSHWKPSEEQMEAMSYFVRKHQATANRATTKWPEFEAFKSLYNDLKKRM